MANNDILQYLRKTPHNTNVNVVKGMIGNESGGGAIEMTTVFDEDITFTDYVPGSQYGSAHASGFYELPFSTIEKGILKCTYENFNFFIIYTPGAGSGRNQGFGSSSDDDTPCGTISIGQYNEHSFNCVIYPKGPDVESEFEAYCQTPHHLKIEWFIV